MVLDVFANEPLKEFPPPKAQAPWADHSGRVTLRIPRILHAQLDHLAEEQGVSLNHLMSSILQSAATSLLAGLEFGTKPTNSSESYEAIGMVREKAAVKKMKK